MNVELLDIELHVKALRNCQCGNPEDTCLIETQYLGRSSPCAAVLAHEIQPEAVRIFLLLLVGPMISILIRAVYLTI